MKHLVAPSLLSANFLELGKDIDLVNKSQADWFHVDIMDGLFVPNISFGFPVIKAIKKVATKPLDVHLMIHEPQRYVSEFKDAGADILSVHVEGNVHLHRIIQSIKSLDMKAGVVVNPHTNVIVLENILSELDLVCLMAVNPGFGAQKFIPETYKKIVQLKEMILKLNSKALIEVDGGVDLNNAHLLIDAGVDILVAGNAVFASDNPLDTIVRLKTCR